MNNIEGGSHTVSVAELKRDLSKILAIVRGGTQVFVTCRDEVIAQLEPLADDCSEAMQLLIKDGVVSPPAREDFADAFEEILAEMGASIADVPIN